MLADSVNVGDVVGAIEGVEGEGKVCFFVVVEGGQSWMYRSD